MPIDSGGVVPELASPSDVPAARHAPYAAAEDLPVCLTSMRALRHADCGRPGQSLPRTERGSSSRQVPSARCPRGKPTRNPRYRAAVRAQSPAAPATGRPISQ